MFDINKKKLKEAFSKIKEELDEHREAINSNTNELQQTQEFLDKLDEKIDKLQEKIETLKLSIHEKEEESYSVTSLTFREKEVFLVLYESEEMLTYEEIAKKLGLTKELVASYVTNLVIKGVPVIKKYSDSIIYVILDSKFKASQAKRNIIPLV